MKIASLELVHNTIDQVVRFTYTGIKPSRCKCTVNHLYGDFLQVLCYPAIKFTTSAAPVLSSAGAKREIPVFVSSASRNCSVPREIQLSLFFIISARGLPAQISPLITYLNSCFLWVVIEISVKGPSRELEYVSESQLYKFTATQVAA